MSSEEPIPSHEFFDNDGEYHFDDACTFPALIVDGTNHYYLHGVRHRPNGPACVSPNGSASWFINGEFHREDGPANISIDGDSVSTQWYRRDLFHRMDGPATICLDVPDNTITLTWWRHDDMHNTLLHEFGSGISSCPAYMKFTLDNFPTVLIKKFQETHDLNNDDIFNTLDELDYANAIELRWHVEDKLHRDDGPAIIYRNGTEMWYIDGELHRADDEPAIIKLNGFQAWYQNGQRHRKIGPAVVTELGDQHWYKYGVHHRKNGPAIVLKSGQREWYVRGIAMDRDGEPNRIFSDGQQEWAMTFDGEAGDSDFEDAESIEHPGRYHLLHRTDGPAVIFPDGDHAYYVEGVLHSIKGKRPAITYEDGTQEYYHHGRLHRLGGPAVVGGIDPAQYWFHGTRVFEDNSEYLRAENAYVCKRLCRRQRTPNKGLEEEEENIEEENEEDENIEEENEENIEEEF